MQVINSWQVSAMHITTQVAFLKQLASVSQHGSSLFTLLRSYL